MDLARQFRELAGRFRTIARNQASVARVKNAMRHAEAAGGALLKEASDAGSIDFEEGFVEACLNWDTSLAGEDPAERGKRFVHCQSAAWVAFCMVFDANPLVIDWANTGPGVKVGQTDPADWQVRAENFATIAERVAVRIETEAGEQPPTKAEKTKAGEQPFDPTPRTPSDQRSSLSPITEWLGVYQRKIQAGEPLHRGDAFRLRVLLRSAPTLRKAAAEGLRAGRGIDALSWVAFFQELPKVILAAGRQVGVDMTPVVRLFKAWKLEADGGEVASADATRYMVDAESAWDVFEVALRPAPDDQIKQVSIEQMLDEVKSISDELADAVLKARVDDTEATEPGDKAGMVLSSTLPWPPEINTDSKRRRFLDKHTDSVPSERHGQRRLVDAAAFIRFFRARDATASEQLDSQQKEPPPLQPELFVEGAVGRLQEIRKKKQRRQ